MSVRCFVTIAVLMAVPCAPSYADNCYVDGEATCEELTGEVGNYCDLECNHIPLLGDFCNQEEVALNGPVNVAVHDEPGQESITVGATVNCKSTRACKGYCGWPAPEEILYCSDGTGSWTHSDPYAHTYPSGNSCGEEY